MLSVVMQSVIMLDVFVLNVVMLNVVMLGVVGPHGGIFNQLGTNYKGRCYKTFFRNNGGCNFKL